MYEIFKFTIIVKILPFIFLFFGFNSLFCQIPSLGTFEYKFSLEFQNESSNPFLAAFTKNQHVVFYNDSMIVTLQRSALSAQSYNFMNKYTGDCIIIEKDEGFYVQTNAKDLRVAFDFTGISQTNDTIKYDTFNFEYLGEICKKVSQKYVSLNKSHHVINEKLSYYSKLDDKQIYIPLAEYGKDLGYEFSKKVELIDTVFDRSIFDVDTVGLQRLDLTTYVNTKLGFPVFSDSTFAKQNDQNGLYSIFKGYKNDDFSMDTFFIIKEAVSKFNYETLLDSVKNLKPVEPKLLEEIIQKYKTERIDEILTNYYFKKILSSEKGRKILLENLDFAGIKLKNDKSPLTLEKYKKEGYPLDDLISELKGYHRLVVNLEEFNVKDVIYDIFKMVLPEYAHEPLSVKVNRDDVELNFRDNSYKLSFQHINESKEDYSILHYKKYFINQQIRELFAKMSVDLDLNRKIGICDFSQIRSLYGPDYTIDTFLICAFDKDFGIKAENLPIGLSFHDSLQVSKQLKIYHLYSESNSGYISFPLNFNNIYLKSSKLREFQKFYELVGENNKYIRKMMFESAENIPYALTDLERIFVFFFDYYLDENRFIPDFLAKIPYEKENMDTICDFNIAFPKIYDLLNRKLNIKNIYMKKNKDWHYLVQFNFKGREYKIVGTYEEVAFGCVKTIDQILASDKKYKYRIYTSLESNDFYKKLIILRKDEIHFFEQASGISLSTFTK